MSNTTKYLLIAGGAVLTIWLIGHLINREVAKSDSSMIRTNADGTPKLPR